MIYLDLPEDSLWNSRDEYDPTATYYQFDVVWITVSGVDYAYGYLGKTAITGVSPTTTGRGWVRGPALSATPLRGLQGIRGEVPTITYSLDGLAYSAGYTAGSVYKKYTWQDGTSTIEIIRGEKGEKGDTPVVKDGKDGKDAPPVIVEFTTDGIEWIARQTTSDADIAFRLRQDDRIISGVIPIEGRPGRDGKDSNIVFATDDTFANSSPVGRSIDTKFRFERDGLPVSVTYDVHPPNISGSGVSRADAQQIAHDAAEARYTDEEKAQVAEIQGIIDRLNNLSPDVNFAIVNYRESRPIPPVPSQVEAFAKGLLTIGIGTDGVLWTLKDIPAQEAEGDWNDWDTPHWEGEFPYDLLPSALDAGDFWYNYSTDMWGLFDGTDITHHRSVTDILQDYIFVGQFPNGRSATQHIKNYDSTKNYLAYNHISGFAQGEVEILSNYVAGRGRAVTWVNTNETLNHKVAQLATTLNTHQQEILKINEIATNNATAIGENKATILDNQRAVEANKTAVEANKTAIEANASAIQQVQSDREGTEIVNQTIQNVNLGRTDDEAIDDISFSGIAAARTSTLSQYEFFIVEIAEYAENSNTEIIDTTSVVFRYDTWLSLKGIKHPQQGDFQPAHTDDNRALRFAWGNNPPPKITIAGGSGQANRIREAVERLSEQIRASSRILFIGRSTIQTDNNPDPDPRMLIAVTGIKQNFHCRVFGYKGE